MPQGPTLEPIDETAWQTPPPAYAPPAHSYGLQYQCRWCGSPHPPTVLKRVSSGGWVFFVIFLLVCLPISLFAFAMKEEYRICPVCGAEQ